MICATEFLENPWKYSKRDIDELYHYCSYWLRTKFNKSFYDFIPKNQNLEIKKEGRDFKIIVKKEMPEKLFLFELNSYIKYLETNHNTANLYLDVIKTVDKLRECDTYGTRGDRKNTKQN